MSPRYAYKPDYAVSPGAVLEEILSSIGMKKTDLARRCHRPEKVISEILHAKAAVTPETAIQFERVLDRPAAFWLQLQAQYDLRRAEQNEDDEIESHADWADRFPVKALVDRGVIKPAHDAKDLVRKLLKFFGVASVDAWRDAFEGAAVAFRQSPAFEARRECVAAWLRLGELQSAGIECGRYDRKRFLAVLRKARSLTTRPHLEAWKQLVAQCAAAGVALAWVPELPKTHVSGAARWLTKDKALIQLSGRYKTMDHFWFTFFHEAGHIVLHGKKQVFIDDDSTGNADAEEQANVFARNNLIPQNAYEAFVEEGRYGDDQITAFARRIGIAPGIVVGRLQHDKVIKWTMGTALKLRMESVV
jgi:addiction module HigA family antidote